MSKRKRCAESEPSFIAIMRGESCAEKLRVPQMFMKYLLGDLKSTATLITNSTTCWRVGVSPIDDTVCFKGGWENFFRDHSLGSEELVSFIYKGHMHFHVQIFHLNQCQKTKRAPARSQDRYPLIRQPPASVESFTSSFPYFKICLKKSSFHPLYMLPIPKTARMILNLPSVNTDFIMRTRDRVWDVKCLYIEASSAHRFSKGWRSFVDDNGLKPGDTCMFEIVACLELYVTIFRS